MQDEVLKNAHSLLRQPPVSFITLQGGQCRQRSAQCFLLEACVCWNLLLQQLCRKAVWAAPVSCCAAPACQADPCMQAYEPPREVELQDVRLLLVSAVKHKTRLGAIGTWLVKWVHTHLNAWHVETGQACRMAAAPGSQLEMRDERRPRPQRRVLQASSKEACSSPRPFSFQLQPNKLQTDTGGVSIEGAERVGGSLSTWSLLN